MRHAIDTVHTSLLPPPQLTEPSTSPSAMILAFQAGDGLARERSPVGLTECRVYAEHIGKRMYVQHLDPYPPRNAKVRYKPARTFKRTVGTSPSCQSSPEALFCVQHQTPQNAPRDRHQRRRTYGAIVSRCASSSVDRYKARGDADEHSALMERWMSQAR